MFPDKIEKNWKSKLSLPDHRMSVEGKYKVSCKAYDSHTGRLADMSGLVSESLGRMLLS
jgi:hypothetical protein